MAVFGKLWASPLNFADAVRLMSECVPGKLLNSHLGIVLALALSLCVFDSVFGIHMSAGRILGRHWRYRGCRVWWGGESPRRASGSPGSVSSNDPSPPLFTASSKTCTLFANLACRRALFLPFWPAPRRRLRMPPQPEGRIALTYRSDLSGPQRTIA